MNRDPSLQAIPRLTRADGTYEPAEPLVRSIRAKIFVLAFGIVAAAGMVLTLLQPSVFQASATVLMTAPVAIDDQQQEANVQSVAIQRRILLGSEVTQALLAELGNVTTADINAAKLRELLHVDPVADTNLVEMIARGDNAELLPDVVNTWIDVYLEIRATGIQESQQQTLRMVRDQLAGLDVKLEEAREALALYRAEHDITSAERQENEVMSRLEGLNNALNSAVEAEVLARARIDTMQKAIASGKKIIPKSERESVAAMENQLRSLENQLKALTKNYTLEYVRKQPRYRDIPDRIDELRLALDEVYSESEQLQLSLAQQEYEAAQNSVQQLQKQLEGLEQEAAEFTTIYATHQALAEDLAQLEELNRQSQSRLVEVQVNPVEKYPQVSVIDRPTAQSLRLGPDYLLWLGGTFAAALLAGIASVWLYAFLSPPRPEPAYVTLSGVHMYPQDGAGQLGYTGVAPGQLPQGESRLLANAHDQEPASADEDNTTADGHDSNAPPSGEADPQSGPHKRD